MSAHPPDWDELQVMVGGFKKDLKREDFFNTLEITVAGAHLFFTVVADGHGGKEAARFAAQGVLSAITERIKEASASGLNEAVVGAYHAIHNSIVASGTTAGSTLTVCCVNASAHELSMWNVGDSVAVLVDEEGQERRMRMIAVSEVLRCS